MRKIILFCLFLGIGFSLQAQQSSYKIKGKITDQQKLPLADVLVQLVDNQSISASSDANGLYEISVPFENVSLQFSKIGFQKRIAQVAFSGNENRVSYANITLLDSEIELSEVVVTANDNPSLVTNSKDAISLKMNKIAGGVALADLSSLKKQRSQTLKDAIGNEPGVIIQEFFGGNDQPRLNIRGSGIQSNPQARGVALLQDGIPVNLADGSYIIGVLEPQAAHLVEIYKGANALQYGSSSLGGAINFVTKNGYNTSPIAVKLEKGSFDYFNSSISAGFSGAKNDLFVSSSYNHSDGFRANNFSRRFNALLNAGRRFSEKFESRILANYTDMYFDIPGPLTKAQMLDNPKQVNGAANPKVSLGPNVLRDKPNRASKILRLGNKNAYQITDNFKLNTTIYYQYADDVFTFPVNSGIREHFHNDFGGNVSLEHKTDRNYLVIGGNLHYGKIAETYYINRLGNKAGIFSKNDLEAFSKVLFLNEVFSITPKFDVTASLQASWDYRGITEAKDNPLVRPVLNFQTNTFTNTASTAINGEFNYFGFNPKVGVIYSPSKQTQIYANFSRSYEPPTFIELLNITGGTVNSSPNKIKISDLSAQTASSFEVGSRGKIGTRFNWNVSLYHSIIDGELLTIADQVGISGETINSPSKTIHQGAEVGVDVVLLRGILAQNDDFSIKGVYNFSDFYFKDGLYEGKQIAGIPQHYLQGSVSYKHPVGIYLNFNTESSLKDTFIDHTNELFQEAYTVLNARIGFQYRNWGIFVDGRNLSDKIYASSYIIRDKTNVSPQQAILGATKNTFTNYIPAVGRNIVVGFNYTF